MSINKFIFIIALLGITGCGTINGEFAYKDLFMDSYHKFTDGLEITANHKIFWTYHVLHKVRSETRIGIITQKKELVWVDIAKEFVTIRKDSPNIHGEINYEQEGEYQIILIQNDKIADRVGFRIVPKDDETEE